MRKSGRNHTSGGRGGERRAGTGTVSFAGRKPGGPKGILRLDETKRERTAGEEIVSIVSK